MPKTIHRYEYELLRGMLRELRVAAGMSQTAVSEGMGRSQSFVSDIERGVRRLDAIELRDVCLLLGTSLPDFLDVLEQRISSQNRASAKRRKPSRA
ncbi:MAG: helix-turn-helix transcriptional regulator [Bryocella sp.]